MPTTTAPRSEDGLISLRAGLAVHTSVFVWISDASFRLQFTVQPDGRLHIAPRAAIRPADDVFIRQHRDEVVAAVRYCDE